MAKGDLLTQLFKSEIPVRFQIQLPRQNKIVDVGPLNQEAAFVLVIHSYRFVFSVFFKGLVMSMAEAFLDGSLQVKGDLIAALKAKNYIKPECMKPLFLLKILFRTLVL